MSRERLRVGLIGAGTIAGFHLRSYAANPAVDLVGIHDRNMIRAESVASAYGADRAYASLTEMLADPGIDAVSICTWNDSHSELAVAALDAGKHVLVEKPLSRSVTEAIAVEEAVARSGKHLQVGFVRRFGDNALTLKRFIDAGAIGEVYYAKAANLRRIGNPGGWFADVDRSGGGPLVDIGVHVIDLCWYMMGSPAVTTVSANTYSHLGNRANITNLTRYKATDYDPSLNTVEDLVNALIRFENGSSLLLDTSYSVHATDDKLEISLFGDRGGAELEPALRLVSEQHDTILNITPQLDHPSFEMDEGFRNELAHFVDLCLGKAEDIATASQGVEVMRMVEAIYRSAAEGREIDVR
ncbi:MULTISPECIES: Gfo/Idh/MocA family protein [unclassified Rathayibacter]|uniref:Gfo/Idh/MocA family protein n=1 Tax=unclassified Rathayibacter TaxID=2609250 RepID=UPI0006FAB7D6|nr:MULTISPECIES: Gfo/Idh/MocA family oxidoreductase [unclassified Rathayibacter]KQQ05609.1 oxidoreductase [Rathayibacter sp. Leaf294]KQS13470.1 oxidoreductase [Rathayibacter sp. Leaf185]